MALKDFKNNSGKWARWHKVGGKRVHTRASLLWENMCARCRKSGAYQKLNPSYVGVTHKFSDFQDFAEWSICQIGYEDGFEIDKDLLIKGNKIYSKNSILFLPKEINRALPNCKAARGLLPVGVSTDRGAYCMSCRTADGSRVFERGFKTPEQAFLRYKELKETSLKVLAEKWKGMVDERAYSALINYVVDIND